MNSTNYTFLDNERIVRIIYSPKTINPNNKNLKANFVGFSYNSRTNKYELSCNRLEMDTIENLRMLGKHYENPPKAVYYGLACISVQKILTIEGLELAFTPLLDQKPENPTHCDIYDNSIPQPGNIGEAQEAEVNYRRSVFVKLWKAYEDKETLVKEEVQPLG